MSSDGLGLDEFLGFDPDAEKGSGGVWLKPWKKEGSIDIFLHLGAKIHPVWNHQFLHEIEIDEKNDKGEKTGRKELKLSWPRFVSPDVASIHANQYFRDKQTGILSEQFNKDKNKKLIGGSQAEAYMRDPFLILREYLYHAVEKKLVDPESVLFEWINHKKRDELIQWRVGEITGHIKRKFDDRGNNVNTKLEYIFVVVNFKNPGDGPKIARTTKLIGDKMREEIARQIESKGVEGNPFEHPYCFRWRFNANEKVPMKMYDVFRVDKNPCTDEIWQAIGGAPDPEKGETWDIIEAPETAEYANVNDGDMDKIRQAFEQAAQFKLPLDEIFSDDWKVRESVVTGAIITGGAQRPSSTAASSQQARPAPGATPGAARQTTAATPAPVARSVGARTVTAPTTPAAPASEPQSRRKKKEEPKPVEPPPVEMITCEGPDDETPCGHMLRMDEAKCPKCGAEYDIGEQVVAPEPPPPKPQPTAPNGARRPPATTQAVTESNGEEAPEAKCIACGDTRLETVTTEDGGTAVKCGNCGFDQGDTIPF